MDINQIMTSLEAKHPGESEYLQAVKEVLLSIEDIYNQHPEFEKASLIERLVEPDRIFTFKVPWVDDKGKVQVNLGDHLPPQIPLAGQRLTARVPIGRAIHCVLIGRQIVRLPAQPITAVLLVLPPFNDRILDPYHLHHRGACVPPHPMRELYRITCDKACTMVHLCTHQKFIL